MTVKIEEINVQGLGPLAECRLRLGLFNLIYGLNERGKTFLVEFVLNSLFKSAAEWKLRALAGSGKVIVSGLAEEPIDFSPTSRRKLEDYWGERIEGLPLNIARLLVVKGAELEMVEGGINKTLLKDYLSSEAVLDTIQARISKTLQGASIENGKIEGDHRGEIKNRRERQDTLKQVDALFQALDEGYSGGPQRALREKQEKLQEDIQVQNSAKKYRAFQLSQEIQALQQAMSDLPKREMDEIEEKYREYGRVAQELEVKQQKRAQLEETAADYEWLKHAISVYETRETDARINLVYPILAVLALIAAAALTFIEFPIATAALIALGLLFGFLTVRQLMGRKEAALNLEEINKVSEEYEQRFQKKLTNLAAMLSLKEALEADYYNVQMLDDEIKELKEAHQSLGIETQARLEQLHGEPCDPEQWGSVLKGLREARQSHDQQIRDHELERNRLNIDPANFVEEDPGVPFDRVRLEKLEKDLSDVQAMQDEEIRNLQNLKQRICDRTGDEISIPWPDLIQSLKENRGELAEQYRLETTEALAKILVNQELQRLRAQEDEKIRSRLRSEAVREPLRHVTGRYERVELKGNQLVVSDPYNEFPLAEISTGAQEQVLLALRIAFASMIMERQKAFLILDDAFQHADWQRRGYLLEEIVGLAQAGWQILYFTMDDHIRDLFDEVGKETFGDQYYFAELPGGNA